MGKRKIQQILFPTPSFFSAEDKARTARAADSVYYLLKKWRFFFRHGKAIQQRWQQCL